MAKSLINLGTTPNDRTGDTLRDAGSKVNSNINEIYSSLGNGSTLQVSVIGATTGQVLKFNGTSFVPSTDLNTDAVTSVNNKVGAVVLTTDDVAEGTTNKYFTDALARAAISASGALSYNSTSGALTFTQGNTDTVAEGTNNQYYTAGRFNFSFSQKTTDDLTEGTTRRYFSNSLARAAISATQNISYNSTTGVLTGPLLSAVASSGSYNDLTDKPSLGATTQWVLDSDGTAINFTGNGFLGTEENPTIYVYRGVRYEFSNQTNSTIEFVDASLKGVRSVTISSGGLYTAAPTVSFSGGTGSGAVGTAVLSTTGSIDTITVTDGGTGYSSIPTISFSSGSGSGAVATAILTEIGSIESVTIEDGGSGYTVAPTLTFTATSGSGAAATATLDGAGAIQSIEITNAGVGYSSDVELIITPDAGDTPTDASTTVNRSLSIASITVSNGGTGYPNTVSAVITPAVGDTVATPAQTVVTLKHPVASVTITNPGTYTVAPNVTFGSGTAAATASIDLKLVPAANDFTVATAANNGVSVLCPLMSTATGTQWKYRLVGDEENQVGDIVVV